MIGPIRLATEIEWPEAGVEAGVIASSSCLASHSLAPSFGCTELLLGGDDGIFSGASPVGESIVVASSAAVKSTMTSCSEADGDEEDGGEPPRTSHFDPVTLSTATVLLPGLRISRRFDARRQKRMITTMTRA